MTYSQKYCLVQLLSPMEIGEEFTSHDWPLHCTIAGVFAVDWTADMLQAFAGMIASHRAFDTTTTNIALFGPDETVKVRRLAMTDNLYALHDSVVTFIEQHDGTFKEPHYLREDFSPHITMRRSDPHENEVISFQQLALIDMFPGADHTRRRIMALLPLATN